MKSKSYRITYEEEGIYNRLKKEVGEKIWKQILCCSEINWLPKPPLYETNDASYFTEKGYKKFMTDTYPFICQYLNKEKIHIEICRNIEDVRYKDEFQVVVRQKQLQKGEIYEYRD